MPTLIETKSAEACAALCRELGFRFIELNMNLPEYQTDALDVPRLRGISAEYGVFYTIHLDENLSPCDFNPLVAEAYTRTVLRTVEIARELDAPILNMHLAEGVHFTLPDRKAFLFGEYESEYLRKLTAFRDVCEAAAGGANVKICIENSGGYNRAPFLTKGLDLLLQSPAFALTFDVGHNAGTGFANEPVITARGDRLRHMHIHDALDRGNHLALGTGALDLQKYLTLAERRGCRAVVEVKTAAGLRGSAQWLRTAGWL
ncbi:MAG: sugar phosphate isomerase/epimerase [Oscillospiraceae bacterium]|jgi:sugar phosphate isomerase/epimerase|nr:sugar phosphate isomerase/epimerase [Oscillospiraceae bacterium]